MARWEPDAVGRLRQAALDLFAERGYPDVTVAEIADRAGLTKRTFFNHFADKREILFAGAKSFEASVIGHLTASGDDLEPIDAAVFALTRAGEELASYGTREFAQFVRGLVASAAELQERDLIKMAALAVTIARTLQELRGVPERSATLAAQGAVAVFTAAYADWIAGPDDDLDALMQTALRDFRDAVDPA